MRIEDINFDSADCIYNYDRCFQYKGEVYEYLPKSKDFRKILSDDDYDYIEVEDFCDIEYNIITELYQVYIAELECMLKVEKHTTKTLRGAL